MENVIITIKSSSKPQECDEEVFELTTDGKYSYGEEFTEIFYMETELTGYDGQKTSFCIEPEKIVLTRAGGLNGEMIFVKGQKHYFVYETPFGSVTMGVDTHKIRNELNEDGGVLEISYAIDVENIILTRNSFTVSVKRER